MNRRRSSGVGLSLLGVGLALWLDRMGLVKSSDLWRAWPLLLVGAGILLWLERGRPNVPGLGPPERLLLIAVTAVGFGLSFGLSWTQPRANHFERGVESTPTAALAALDLETRATRDFDCAGGSTIELAVRAASLVIRAGSDESCRAILRTSAGAGEAPALDISEGSGDDAIAIGLAGSADQPVELTLDVPHGTNLSGYLIDGELDAEGLGVIDLTAESSRVRVVTIEKLRARSQGGSLDARQVAGAVDLEARSSDIALIGVAGTVSLHSSFARLRLSQLSSPLEVTTTGGSVTITRATGGIRLRSEKTALQLNGISGPVTIEATDTNLALDEIQGEVAITARGGSVRLQDLHGQLRLSGSPRSALIDRATGNLTVRTTGTILAIHSGKGSLDLEHQGGRIRLRRNLGAATVRAHDAELEIDLDDGGSVDVTTERGNVRLTLENPQLGVDVTTIRGAIRAEPGLPEFLPAETSHSLHLRLPGSPIAARIFTTDGIVRIQR